MFNITIQKVEDQERVIRSLFTFSYSKANATNPVVIRKYLHCSIDDSESNKYQGSKSKSPEGRGTFSGAMDLLNTLLARPRV